MAKSTPATTPAAQNPNPLAGQIPDPSFAEQVTVTGGLDTKTYRLANRANTPALERELAERVLLLESAPEGLKLQAQQVLAR